MLRALFDLFNPDAPAPSGKDAEAALQLATAVLFVEVMRAEPATSEAERAAVVHALRHHFTLAPDELDRLVDLANERAQTANDFHAFTSKLNDAMSHADKVRVIEFMWRVAFADGHLDAHENHLISKVAGLLHVTHGEYIAAKMHARE